MSQFVTITSQGQISIPAKVRKLLGLETSTKAIYFVRDNQLIIEPAKDFLKMAGVFKDKAIKNKSINDVIKMEKKAAREYRATL